MTRPDETSIRERAEDLVRPLRYPVATYREVELARNVLALLAELATERARADANYQTAEHLAGDVYLYLIGEITVTQLRESLSRANAKLGDSPAVLSAGRDTTT